jgi:hypothetical protein
LAARARQTGVLFLVLALITFTAAAAVLIRDLGASTSSNLSGTLEPLGTAEVVFYAYELPHDLAISSTVEVHVLIRASFGSWQREFDSNGTTLTAFRPAFPGVHRILVTNLENRSGQLGVSLLQLNTPPPEVETSLLQPLLLIAAILLVVSFAMFTLADRWKKARQDGGGTHERR